MGSREELPVFEPPSMEYEPMEPIHAAKSWNPGKGKDKTGTGNSDHGGQQGNKNHGGKDHDNKGGRGGKH